MGAGSRRADQRCPVHRCRLAGFGRGPVILLVALVAAGVTGAAIWEGRVEVEAARIAEVLEVGAGDTVADVGAGEGEWAVELARRVGPGGHVYATEVNPERLDDIREAVSEAALDNVTIVEGNQRETGLPAGCCDAILLRLVYHHFTDPAAMHRSLLEALRPGGLILVIDFEPGTTEMRAPEGVPGDRGGHGMPLDLLLEEMAGAGFELVRRIDDWIGDRYAVLFRRPPSSGPGAGVPAGGLYGLLEPGWARAPLWDDGNAELNLYRARLRREFALRSDAYAVHLVVKEPFTPRHLVKADDWRAAGVFDVLKLNRITHARTGLYDWDEMVSAFIDRVRLVPVKMTYGRQEWCGNVFKEWRRWRDQQFLFVSSYFDGTGTQRLELPLPDEVVPYDALPVLLRALRVGQVRAGQEVRFPLLPTLRGVRAGPTAAVEARLRVAGREEVTVPAGSFGTVRLELGFPDGRGGTAEEAYWIETAAPNRLVRFQGATGEFLELARSERVPYWRMSGDEVPWYPAPVLP